MSKRLNLERERELQPERLAFAKAEIEKLGLEIITVEETRIDFMFNGNKISIYPYSGWFSGKGIKDGRGIGKLVKQLTQ